MDNMFCFIACVNDEQMYKESLFYIKQLDIPQGFSIECRAVRNARSITEGYNAAMNESDAKYKIYMHQDVFILNRRFLFDLLDIFKSDETIGLVGMVGSPDIPEHGVWWESEHTFGCVYGALAEETVLHDYRGHTGRYGETKIVDGLLMATQYDLPWREDLFDGWHFYDASQCCEFLRKKYKVYVANQYSSDAVPTPWCLHYIEKTVTTAYYENYRNVFLREYNELIYANADEFEKEKLPGISIILLVGDYLDTLWVRLDEIDKYMCKDSYELIVITNHLDIRIQELFKQEGVKMLFTKPDEGTATLLNRANAMAKKQNDIMLLDCRISVKGSITVPIQNALYTKKDIGAVCCTADESLTEIMKCNNEINGLFMLYKRVALDKTGFFDERFITESYTVYDHSIGLMSSGYNLLTRNFVDVVLQSNDDPQDLQSDKLKFKEKRGFDLDS